MNIIFDLDGTLWNSSETVFKSWSNIFLHENINITLKEIKNLFGLTNPDIIKWLMKEKGINKKYAEKILYKCQQEEIEFIKKEGGILYDCIKETLNKLSKKYNLFIVSNCQQGYIEAFLQFYKFNKYFKDFECSGNTGKDKSYNINLVIKRNKLNNVIYVGDTLDDSIASFKCNIPFVYATYGFGKVNYSKYKIDNFKDLINLCYNLERS